MFTITISATMSQLISNNNLSEMIDGFTQRFINFRDWCIINLDVGTWEMAELDTQHTNTSISFSHTFTFDNQEDATAFKLTFEINTDYVCN